MAKSRKKTLGQQVVGAATIAMPTPIQQVAGSRWGSRLILLLTPLLFLGGIVTVNWSDGVPHLQINRERAQEVGHNIVDKIEDGAGVNVGQEHKFQWALPNDRGAATAPIQQFLGQGQQQQQPAAAFPRLESATNAAAGFLEAPSQYFPGQNAGQSQARGSVLPGSRY